MTRFELALIRAAQVDQLRARVPLALALSQKLCPIGQATLGAWQAWVGTQCWN